MLDNQTTRCIGRRDDRTLCEKSYACARHLAIRTDFKEDELAPVGLYLCAKEDNFIGVNDDKARAAENATA